MIHVDNRTPLDVAVMDAVDKADERYLSVIAKGIFVIRHGDELEFDSTPRTSSLLDEDDLVPFKLGTDVLARATAYAPGRNATQWRAGISVGALKKYVTVTGPRAWMHAPLIGWSLTPAAAVHHVPLTYEYAYGGEGFAANPMGIGYVDPRKLDRGMVIPAPQIIRDDGAAPVFGKDYPVETFLPLRRDWPPRSEAEPFEVFHAAPPSRVMEGYLLGNEEVVLEGMHPEHERFAFRLPNQLVAAAMIDHVGFRYGSPGRLDTVFVDMEAGRVSLVWRVTMHLFKDGVKRVDVAMRRRLA